MELKGRKNVLCLIVVGLLDLRVRAVNQMLRVQRGEGCFMIYELVASFKAEKRKVNEGDASFRVSPLSLSLSLSCSPSLSVGVLVHLDRHLPSFDLYPQSRNLTFISFFFPDQIRLGFLCFLLRKGLSQKLLLITFF